MTMTTTTRMTFMGATTTRVFNPVTRIVVGNLPGFGILTHVGRASGRVYRTPLLVLRRGDRFVVGLWYGSDVNWLKNVLAAGMCQMRIRGHDLRMAEPEVVIDPTRALLPLLLRLPARLLGVTAFLRMRST